MGTKRAIVVLTMARDGKSVSARDIGVATRVSGLSVANLRTGHVNPYVAKTYEDDEDLSDQAVA
ncbi:MAG: hypothetical protein AAB619_00060 [Patescibacteria group bacterium]